MNLTASSTTRTLRVSFTLYLLIPHCSQLCFTRLDIVSCLAVHLSHIVLSCALLASTLFRASLCTCSSEARTWSPLCSAVLCLQGGLAAFESAYLLSSENDESNSGLLDTAQHLYGYKVRSTFTFNIRLLLLSLFYTPCDGRRFGCRTSPCCGKTSPSPRNGARRPIR